MAAGPHLRRSDRAELIGPLVFLVRSGEATNNTTVTISNTIENIHPLTEKGERQAINAGQMLRSLLPNGFPVEIISYSPIPRAQQTARVIKYFIGAELQTEPLLIERDFRSLNNYSFKSNNEMNSFLSLQARDGYPAIESWGSLQLRGKHFAETISNRKLIIAVSHEAPIKSIISTRLNYRSEFNMTAYSIELGSISVIDFGDKRNSGIYGLNFTRFDQIAQ